MRADWNISGSGILTIEDEPGLKRCRLAKDVMLLWNGNSSLANSEIIADIKFTHTSSQGYSRGGLLLRSNANATNCYRLYADAPRNFYIQRIVNGVITTLTTYNSNQPYNQYIKTRFRIDGYQLSLEEYVNGEWLLRVFVNDIQNTHASGFAGFCSDMGSPIYSILFDNIEISVRV